MGPVIATMNLPPETSEKIIFWMITAIAGSSLRCCSAREANTPLAVQSGPQVLDARLRAPQSGERLSDLGLSALPLPEVLDHDVK